MRETTTAQEPSRSRRSPKSAWLPRPFSGPTIFSFTASTGPRSGMKGITTPIALTSAFGTALVRTKTSARQTSLGSLAWHRTTPRSASSTSLPAPPFTSGRKWRNQRWARPHSGLYVLLRMPVVVFFFCLCFFFLFLLGLFVLLVGHSIASSSSRSNFHIPVTLCFDSLHCAQVRQKLFLRTGAGLG